MKSGFLAFFLPAAFFAMHGSIYAQLYDFKKLDSSHGLAHNQVTHIIQARDGYLWMSTLGGLSKFNGKNFVNFTTNEGLGSNLCLTVFEDSKNRIWAGTYDKGAILMEQDSVSNIGVEYASSHGPIDGILEGHDRTVYILFSNLIMKYNDDQPRTLEKLVSVNINLGKALMYDKNTIVAATYNGGIAKISIDTQTVTYINNESAGINNIQYEVFVDKKGSLWSGGYGELVKYDNWSVSKIYKFDGEDYDKNRVKSIEQLSDNELLLGLEGNSIGIFNVDTEELNLINKKNGFPSPFVYAVLKDREENMWLGTYGDGVIRYRDSSLKLYDESHGLPSKHTTHVLQNQNTIYISTEKGLALMENEKVTDVLFNTNHITSVAKYFDDDLLITTDEKLIRLLKNGDKKIIDENVYSLTYHDSTMTILSSFKFAKFITKDSTYNINTRRFLDAVPIGTNYVLANLSGLYQFKDGILDTIQGLNPSEHRIFRTLDSINPNEILAGNPSGIYHLKYDENEYAINFYPLSRFGALENFNALKVDGANLWLAGDRILKKVDLDNLLTNNSITYADYYLSKEFFPDVLDNNGLYTLSQNRIAGTSTGGLLIFDEDRFVHHDDPPQIKLGQTLLFAEPLKDSMYLKDKKVILPFKKNHLTFNMEAITFTYPEHVQYKYRLKGLRTGDDWSLPTKETKVVYSYLPPGEYSFEFMADNGNGIWSNTASSYVFQISQPFWKSIGFWLLTISLLSATALLVMGYKNRQERKRMQRFSQGLIEAQEQERIRVARELHDGVSQQLMMITRKSKDMGDQVLEILSKNTLNNLRNISHNLHPAVLEQLGFYGALQELVAQLNSQESVQFSVKSNTQYQFSKDEALHLYRIVQEVCQNILKHAEAEKAKIELINSSNKCLLKISDNGKGFDTDNKLAKTKSLGIKSINERCNIIGADLRINSTSGKGTSFLIQLN